MPKIKPPKVVDFIREGIFDWFGPEYRGTDIKPKEMTDKQIQIFFEENIDLFASPVLAAIERYPRFMRGKFPMEVKELYLRLDPIVAEKEQRAAEREDELEARIADAFRNLGSKEAK